MNNDLMTFSGHYILHRRHGSLRKERNVKTPFDAIEKCYKIKPDSFKQNPLEFKNEILFLKTNSKTSRHKQSCETYKNKPVSLPETMFPMKKLLSLLSIFLILLSFSCQKKVETNKTKKENKHIECKEPPIQVLMHNRMGIRVNYNISEQVLELWFSPKAGESVDIFDRNFSNRDDHTRLFDKISFPHLKKENFLKCDYDPFHSVIVFENQKMHIASLFDQPILMIWFENDEIIDFKTDKGDTIAERSAHVFHSKHYSRGYLFDYVAHLAKTDTFQHQLQTAYGRSDYARAFLSADKPVFIGATLHDDNIKHYISQNLTSHQQLLSQTQKIVEENLQNGKIKLKEKPDLQRLFFMNKKSFLAEQDASGYMPATIKEVGCLPYIRDGAWAFSYAAYTGWTYGLNLWNRYLISNPTVIETENPRGKLFGQLVGPITKWEEDGAFHAIWSAFSYHTQTGDSTYNEGIYLENLKAAMDWIERYCYNPEKGLFGRYYYVETALRGSRDDGWDNAVGKPSTQWAPKDFKGNVIQRSYDTYINTLNYSNYLMLAAMTKGQEQNDYLKKALQLEKKLNQFYRDSIIDYGILVTQKGKEIPAKAYEFSHHDFIWGQSVPLLCYDPLKTMQIREQILTFLQNDLAENYAASYYGLLASLDTEFHPEDEIMTAIEKVAKLYYVPGKYLPMPYMLGEQTVIDEGNYYTDIRPMPFAAGPFLAAVMNLGIKRMPFGVALRPNNYILTVKDYEYKNALIDFKFQGEGQIQEITVNGKTLTKSLQIPENWLMNGKNTIQIRLSVANQSNEPLLVYSSLELTDITDNSLFFKGYGKNYLIFKNAPENLNIINDKNENIDYQTFKYNNYTQYEFNGFGEYIIVL